MPIEIDMLAKGTVCAFVCTGTLTVEQIEANQDRWFAIDPRPKLLLWDLGDATLAGVSIEETRQLVERSLKLSEEHGYADRIAFHVIRPVDYGLCRAAQIFAGLMEYPVEVEVFRDRQAAMEWLVAG